MAKHPHLKWVLLGSKIIRWVRAGRITRTAAEVLPQKEDAVNEDLMRRLKLAALAAGVAGTMALPGCASEEPQVVYGPPNNPSAEQEDVEEIYGPPGWLEGEPGEGDEEFLPPEDLQVVYGPPEWFEDEEAASPDEPPANSEE